MKTFKISLNYASPLLMHSTKGVDPLNPISKELKKITSKRTKTDEDHMAMAALDFRLGAYYEEGLGFYLPAEMVEACIREGCKANKNGTKAKVAIFVNEEKIKLQHDGPDTLEEAYQQPDMKDVRIVTVNNSKILRCRPRFNRWAVEFTLDLDETILNPEELIQAIDIAGKQKGLGDYRPRYGRFSAKVEEIA
ncbi:MAG TPA: hypothetical protein VK190_03535 [Pseudoneobacillus sp.]|nr:hypothetical protein [Pseudoneobacillus sp.]